MDESHDEVSGILDAILQHRWEEDDATRLRSSEFHPGYPSLHEAAGAIILKIEQAIRHNQFSLEGILNESISIAEQKERAEEECDYDTLALAQTLVKTAIDACLSDRSEELASEQITRMRSALMEAFTQRGDIEKLQQKLLS